MSSRPDGHDPYGFILASAEMIAMCLAAREHKGRNWRRIKREMKKAALEIRQLAINVAL